MRHQANRLNWHAESKNAAKVGLAEVVQNTVHITSMLPSNMDVLRVLSRALFGHGPTGPEVPCSAAAKVADKPELFGGTCISNCTIYRSV